MTPLRDPVKNIVYNATGRTSIASGGGRLVVDRAACSPRTSEILADLQAGGDRMWPRMEAVRLGGAQRRRLSPPTYREWA